MRLTDLLQISKAVSHESEAAFLCISAQMVHRERPDQGLPQYVFVDDDDTIWALDGFDVMEKTYRFENLAKGRRMYRARVREA